MQELKAKFEEVENRIRKLISLHEQLRQDNKKLHELNRKLEMELKDEKSRYSRLEAGMENLHESKKIMASKSISGIKQKINEMIGEIDRSAALISTQQNNK